MVHNPEFDPFRNDLTIAESEPTRRIIPSPIPQGHMTALSNFNTVTAPAHRGAFGFSKPMQTFLELTF
jgi:hypothetical protein